MQHGHVQLFAVQAGWPLAVYRDSGTFRGQIARLMGLLAGRRQPDLPALVAFPEFVGLPLLFLDAQDVVGGCTRWVDAVTALAGAKQTDIAPYCREFGVRPLRALMLARSEEVRAAYEEAFSAAAAAHRCYIVAGSVPLPEFGDGGPLGGQVYNTSFFFGPEGELIGRQSKLYPYGRQGAPDGLDIVPAPPGAYAFATPFGKVGIAICFDAFQPDVIASLAAEGARVVVQPSANAHAWDDWQDNDWKRGLWAGVQQHPSIQYGVNPMMVGSVFSPGDEYTCEGRSSIVAKVALSPDASGFVARASEQGPGEYAREEVVAATVALD